MDEKGRVTALAKRYRVRVPISDIRDALGDLCGLGRISRSGNLYSVLLLKPDLKTTGRPKKHCCFLRREFFFSWNMGETPCEM